MDNLWIMAACEVRTYVEHAEGIRTVRTQNEAANAELVRRGLPELVVASGELVGSAVVYVNTCTGAEVIEPGGL